MHLKMVYDVYANMMIHSDSQPCRRCSGCILTQSELLWGSDLSSHPCGPAQLEPDLIIGSDITYDEAQFQPLLHTISAYLDHNSNVKVCLHCIATLNASFLDPLALHVILTASFLHPLAVHVILTALFLHPLALQPILTASCLHLLALQN